MSATIMFVCPQCKVQGLARPEWVGKRIKCPRCGTESRIRATELGLAPPEPKKPASDFETVHDLLPAPLAAPPCRWEYRVVKHNRRELLRLLDELNALGDEGWECVGVLEPPDMLLYKRPKASAKESADDTRA